MTIGPVEQMNQLSGTLEAFESASQLSFKAWEKAIHEGKEPTLLDYQMRAIVLGIRANFILQGFRLGEEVGEQGGSVLNGANATEQSHLPSEALPLEVHDELLTTSGAAELVGVHQRTIQKWSDQGILESTRTPGGHRRIHSSAIRRLMNVS